MPGGSHTLDRLRAVVAAAEEFYCAQLRESTPDAGRARQYLEDRLPGGVGAKWRIGYAPGDGGALLSHLRRQGFDPEEMVAAGVVKPVEGGHFADRFRHRLTFPIHDEVGRPCSFSARTLSRNPKVPKYLNGPTTAIYKKDTVLFGLSQHRQRLAAGARVVLVEGPVDVVAADGVEACAVAACGTAFGPAQAQLLIDTLAQLTDQAPASPAGIGVCFDPDEAGNAATVNAWRVLNRLVDPNALPLTFHELPDGHDPASLGKVDPELLRSTLTDGAVSLTDGAVDARLADPRRRNRLESRAHGWQDDLADARVVMPMIIATGEAAAIARSCARLVAHHDMDTFSVFAAMRESVDFATAVAVVDEVSHGPVVSGPGGAARLGDIRSATQVDPAVDIVDAQLREYRRQYPEAQLHEPRHQQEVLRRLLPSLATVSVWGLASAAHRLVDHDFAVGRVVHTVAVAAPQDQLADLTDTLAEFHGFPVEEVADVVSRTARHGPHPALAGRADSPFPRPGTHPPTAVEVPAARVPAPRTRSVQQAFPQTTATAVSAPSGPVNRDPPVPHHDRGATQEAVEAAR